MCKKPEDLTDRDRHGKPEVDDDRSGRSSQELRLHDRRTADAFCRRGCAVRQGDTGKQHGRKRTDGADGISGAVPKSGQIRLSPNCASITRKRYFSYIEAHPEYSRVAVVLSGDTGFYSGAKKLSGLFAADPGRYEVEMIPGISSVVCLAARLKTTWEDGKLISLARAGRKISYRP